jgi:spore cortex formation protein SpoVR/YcgB (stage V sporulation)
MKLEEEKQEKTPEHLTEEIKKIAQKINLDSYKKLTELLKEKMNT